MVSDLLRHIPCEVVRREKVTRPKRRDPVTQRDRQGLGPSRKRIDPLPLHAAPVAQARTWTPISARLGRTVLRRILGPHDTIQCADVRRLASGAMPIANEHILFTATSSERGFAIRLRTGSEA